MFHTPAHKQDKVGLAPGQILAPPLSRPDPHVKAIEALQEIVQILDDNKSYHDRTEANYDLDELLSLVDEVRCTATQALLAVARVN